MSSELSVPSAGESIICPYCGNSNPPSALPAMIPGDIDYAMRPCRTCYKPIVLESKVEVVTIVRRVEGIEAPKLPTIDADIVAEDMKQYIESLPQRTCFKCQKKFNSENPCKLKGEIYCDDCFQKEGPEEKFTGGTHPDPEQFLCSGCGTLHPTGEQMLGKEGKICKECFEVELAEREQNTTEAEQMPVPDEQEASSDEKTEHEYIPLPGSKTVSYCIKEDIVCPKYKSNCCGGYTFDVIWGIIDAPDGTWMKECDAIVEGEKNAVQKASSLNQFCKAVNKGEVQLPGGEE